MATVVRDPDSGVFSVRFRFERQQFKRSLKTKNERAATTALARIEETIGLLERGRQPHQFGMICGPVVRSTLAVSSLGNTIAVVGLAACITPVFRLARSPEIPL